MFENKIASWELKTKNKAKIAPSFPRFKNNP